MMVREMFSNNKNGLISIALWLSEDARLSCSAYSPLANPSLAPLHLDPWAEAADAGVQRAQWSSLFGFLLRVQT